MKKIFSLVISALLIVTLSFPVLAQDTYPSTNSSVQDNLVWHDISELETLPYDQTFSYDEMASLLLSHGFSMYDATQMIGEKQPVTYGNTEVRYSLMRMNTFEYKEWFSTYKLQARFTVGLEYVKGAYSPTKLVSLQGSHVYTGDGSKCVFSGTIEYKLVSGNSFYYNFYGDIYKKGTVNWSVGTTVGIGENSSITATISNGDGFVKNVSETETYKSSGLEP